MGTTKSKIAFEICAVTGDYQADDSGPVVHMVLFDEKGNQSPTLTLDNLLQMEAGMIQAKFTIDRQRWSSTKVFGQLHHVEFWRINAGLPLEWYLDKVIVRDRRKGLNGRWEYFFFPVQKWIKSEQHYVVHNCETCLPRQENYPDLREEELLERQNTFVYYQRSKGLPVELAEVPAEESFSFDAQWDIEQMKFELINKNGLMVEYDSADTWPSFDALWNIYKLYNITEPLGLQQWIMNDICFGAQRLKGCNPFVLSLCKTIPENFGVAMEWLKPHLEGWTVKHILEAKRLYMVDYKIMEGLECKNGRVFCAPLALFFFTENRQLKPLAIQLNQQIEEGNPVFVPTDPPEAWMQAKLWFNMVDAVYHTIVVRLLNHLILESIYSAMRRNISQAHPLFKLMAPHFQSLLAVNKKLKEWVFSPEGWIAQNIQLSKKGIRQLLKRAFKQWRFDVNANIHREFETRGVYDVQALSVYPYRDDALLVHKSIDEYVMRTLRLYYPRNRADLLADDELQNWRREVASPLEEGGLGLKGIPGGLPGKKGAGYASSMAGSTLGNGTMDSRMTAGLIPEGMEDALLSVDDTGRFLTGILYLSVIVCGAASRLPMYDEYGCPANYPISLAGELPSDPLESRDREAKPPNGMGLMSPGNEDHISMPRVLAALPNRHETVDVLLSIRLAGKVAQSVLGHPKRDFVFDPKAVAILDDFRARLKTNSQQIEERNYHRDIFHKYICLDPANVPNCPGI